jgi:hypothetical protein
VSKSKEPQEVTVPAHTSPAQHSPAKPVVLQSRLSSMPMPDDRVVTAPKKEDAIEEYSKKHLKAPAKMLAR